ncbi:MAG: hypothetical protein AB7V14_02595 [Kiritimatiellia bacterium]
MDPSVGQTQPQQVPYRPGMPDRRQRKPDVWAQVFRWVTLLVYPLLVVFFFIFFGVASADHNQELAVKIGGEAVQRGGSNVDLYTVLPLLGAGALIGVVGIVLGRKRARRRSDYNYKTQLMLVILSVVGLVLFFLLR